MKNRLNKKEDSKHIKKIFRYTLIILFMILFFISLTGYISVGNDAKKFDLIIQRDPLNGSQDLGMQIGQGVFAFVSNLLGKK